MIDSINMISQICLSIGESLMREQLFIHDNNDKNVQKKTFDEYKKEYLNNLRNQLNNLIEEKGNKMNEYKKVLEYHQDTLNKISILHRKYSFRTPRRASNSTFTFLSLNLKQIKKSLDETIQQNIANSKNICILEEDLSRIEYTINKTKRYIIVNS